MIYTPQLTNPGIKNQTTLGFPNYSSKVTSQKNMKVGSWVRIANLIFQHPKHLFSWKRQVTCTWYTLPIFISTLKAVILSPLLWRTIRNHSQIELKSAESRKVISCKACTASHKVQPKTPTQTPSRLKRSFCQETCSTNTGTRRSELPQFQPKSSISIEQLCILSPSFIKIWIFWGLRTLNCFILFHKTRSVLRQFWSPKVSPCTKPISQVAPFMDATRTCVGWIRLGSLVGMCTPREHITMQQTFMNHRIIDVY